MVETLGSSAMETGKNNIAFISYFILGKLEECLEVLVQSNRCEKELNWLQELI